MYSQLLKLWTTKEAKIKDRKSQWSEFGDDSRLKYRLTGAGNKLHPIIKTHSKLLVSLAKNLLFLTEFVTGILRITLTQFCLI